MYNVGSKEFRMQSYWIKNNENVITLKLPTPLLKNAKKLSL